MPISTISVGSLIENCCRKTLTAPERKSRAETCRSDRQGSMVR